MLFSVTRLDMEWGVAVGIITRIIRQNLNAESPCRNMLLLVQLDINWHSLVPTLARSCPFAVKSNLLYLVQSILCNAAAPIGAAVFICP